MYFRLWLMRSMVLAMKCDEKILPPHPAMYTYHLRSSVVIFSASTDRQ